MTVINNVKIFFFLKWKKIVKILIFVRSLIFRYQLDYSRVDTILVDSLGSIRGMALEEMIAEQI